MAHATPAIPPTSAAMTLRSDSERNRISLTRRPFGTTVAARSTSTGDSSWITGWSSGASRLVAIVGANTISKAVSTSAPVTLKFAICSEV